MNKMSNKSDIFTEYALNMKKDAYASQHWQENEIVYEFTHAPQG